MPFGLDLKSIIFGALLAYFVVPRLLGLFSGGFASKTSTVAGS